MESRDNKPRVFNLTDLPAISSGSLAVVGGGVGLILGPIGSVLGGVVGVVAGLGIGKAAQLWVSRAPISSMILRQKIQMDFSNKYSACHDLRKHNDEVLPDSKMKRDALIEHYRQAPDLRVIAEHGRFPDSVRPSFSLRTSIETHPTDSEHAGDKDLCERMGALSDWLEEAQRPLRIALTTVHAAACGVVRSLAEKYSLPIELVTCHTNGRFLAERVDADREGYFDFLITAEGSLLQNGDDRSGLADYRRVLVIHSQLQRVLAKGFSSRPWSSARFVYKRSTAVEQHSVETGPFAISATESIEDIRDVDTIAKELRHGDELILWEPIAGAVARRHSLHFADREYLHYVSAFAHKRWLNRSSPLYRLGQTFTQAFVGGVEIPSCGRIGFDD
ncbi:MAG: hypothetical protein AAFN41_09290 [Planctomycetota bacterium]